MAQTKTSKSKQPNMKSSGRTRAKTKSSGRSRANGSRQTAKTSGGTAKSSAPSSKRSKKTSSSKRSAAKSVDHAAAAQKAAAAGTRAAGKAVGVLAERAKVPLALGGAAVAGIAGGLAVRNRARSRRRGFGLALGDGKLDLDSLAGAAKRLGAFSNQVGEVAAAMQQDGQKKR
jgi:hypothetical protein